jgi:hypothetical protein
MRITIHPLHLVFWPGQRIEYGIGAAGEGNAPGMFRISLAAYCGCVPTEIRHACALCSSTELSGTGE